GGGAADAQRKNGDCQRGCAVHAVTPGVCLQARKVRRLRSPPRFANDPPKQLQAVRTIAPQRRQTCELAHNSPINFCCNKGTYVDSSTYRCLLRQRGLTDFVTVKGNRAWIGLSRPTGFVLRSRLLRRSRDRRQLGDVARIALDDKLRLRRRSSAPARPARA